ncbi:MAG: fibronectin type III domain-containing protein [Actinomycetes bacterium]
MLSDTHAGTRVRALPAVLAAYAVALMYLVVAPPAMAGEGGPGTPLPVGTITGTIHTLTDSLDARAYGRVVAFGAGDQEVGRNSISGVGSFTITNALAGSVTRLEFIDDAGIYAPAAITGDWTLIEGGTVNVGTVNVVLAGFVAGRVLDDGGYPNSASWLRAEVLNSQDQVIQWEDINNNLGYYNYRIKGITPGISVRIRFRDPAGYYVASMLPGFFNVPSDNGEYHPADFAIADAGYVSGTVTGPGAPLNWVYVSAYSGSTYLGYARVIGGSFAIRSESLAVQTPPTVTRLVVHDSDHNYDDLTTLGSWPVSPESVATVGLLHLVPATPTGVPPAPVASAGNAQATVSVSPGTGGTPITYTVTSSGEGRTCTVTVPSTSCTVGGLTNGRPYTFTAHATNIVGSSAESAPSLAVTPLDPSSPPAPSAPAAPTAVAGNASAVVTVTATAGGVPASFTVTSHPGNFTCTIVVPAAACTVSGLTNGTSYTFTATATNAAGTSGSSASSGPVTPQDPRPVVPPTPPNAPTAPTAPRVTGVKAGKKALAVSFKPKATGGAAIDMYQVRCVGPTTKSANRNGSPITAKGLKTGKSYRCSVRAHNRAGWSAFSSAYKNVKVK